MAARLKDPTHKQRMVLTVVTPAQAKAWLSNRVFTRKLTRAGWRDLSLKLLSGTFSLSHEAVALDVHGRLIDGQHRMQAIVEANVPAKLWVCHNVSIDALPDTDSGRKRTAAEELHRACDVPVKHAAKAVAVIGHLARWLADGTFYSNQTKAPPSREVTRLFKQNTDILESVEWCSRMSQTKVACVMFVHWLTMADRPKEAAAFWSTVRSQEGGVLGPALLLSRCLEKDLSAMSTGDSMRASPSGRVRLLAFVVKAYNAHVAGQELQKLFVRTGSELPDLDLQEWH